MTQDAAQMHPEFIKASLRERFGSLQVVADMFGLSLKTVSGAIREPGVSATVERRIAALLNEKPQKLWPDRWRADGTPTPGLSVKRRKKSA
jgi:Ner family transcriptional regulator